MSKNAPLVRMVCRGGGEDGGKTRLGDGEDEETRRREEGGQPEYFH